ncbi:MAG: DUF4314 domain-containing protein [Oscillospiraceae bacterium]
MLKKRYPEGTRICLNRMENDPNPIPSGAGNDHVILVMRHFLWYNV